MRANALHKYAERRCASERHHARDGGALSAPVHDADERGERVRE